MIHDGYLAYVLELLAGWGGVSPRKMFGGYGLFRQGVMFALVHEQQLYFKTDDQNRQQFVALGMQPFCYHKQGKVQQIAYYTCPDEAFEQEEDMQVWAKLAYAAALRCHRVK